MCSIFYNMKDVLFFFFFIYKFASGYVQSAGIETRQDLYQTHNVVVVMYCGRMVDSIVHAWVAKGFQEISRSRQRGLDSRAHMSMCTYSLHKVSRAAQIETDKDSQLTKTVSGVVKVTGSATSTAWHIHSGRPATDSNLLPVRARSKMSSRSESAVNST